MGKKYLDSEGLLYFWQKLKTVFAYKTDIPTVPSGSNTTPNMDGTAAVGTEGSWAHGDHVHPTDTSRAPVDHASTGTTYGTGSSTNYGHVKLSDATDSTTAAASGGTAATPKAVKDALDAAKSYTDTEIGSLSTGVTGVKGSAESTYRTGQVEITASNIGVEAGAEVNQNAFSNITVGSTTIQADAKTDTLTFTAGSNITLTPDATNDSITIAADNTDTKVTQSAAISTNGAYPIILGYSTDTTAVTNTVNKSSNLTYNPSSKALVTGGTVDGFTLAAASAKSVDTSISSGSSSANLPTSAAVATFVSSAIATAQTGAATFQGTAPTTFAPTNYKKGYYWIVGTAGTYVGEVCEPGDMIFAVDDYDSAYSASDFSVIQTNLDITSITNGEIDTIMAA